MELTKHAMVRYAERIAGRDSTLDINTYVAQNQKKIESDLETMHKFSDKVYTGIVGSKSKDPVTVRNSGTWILILDPSDQKLVTLYKVDFKVGEKFNKDFVDMNIKKIREDLAELEEREKVANEEVSAYRANIKNNETQINEYRTMIKNLEQMNIDYKDVIAHKTNEYEYLRQRVREDVENLIQKPEW